MVEECLLFEIDGKTAIVTGAGSGIGAAVARSLFRAGASVLLVDRDEHAVRGVAEAMSERSAAYRRVMVGDVTDTRFRHECFFECRQYLTTPSILIPCAGVTRDGLTVRGDRASGEASVYPEEQFRLVLDVNLVAPYLWAQDFIKSIVEKRWSLVAQYACPPDEQLMGAIVFIGSISSEGNIGQAAYAASKAGIEAVANTLAAEGDRYGIHCSTIHPGFTDTPMVQAMPERVREKLIARTRISRLITPEEIAEMVVAMIRQPALSGAVWMSGGVRLPL